MAPQLIIKDQSPGIGNVHINRPLTNISVATFQREEAFMAARVFQDIPVDKKSDVYFVVPPGDFNRDEMEERAAGTESAGGSFVESSDSYNAKRWALHKDLDDTIRANSDTPLMLERQITVYLTQQALIQRERRFANDFLKSTAWTFSADGAASSTARNTLDFTAAANNNLMFWNDDDSTPIEDMRTMKRAILERTGYMPNVLVLGRPAFDALIDHPDIVNRLNRGQTPGGPAMVNKDAVAALFELDEIVVSDAIVNSAAEGQDQSTSFIVGKHGLLLYRPPMPGLLVPAAGYTFVWRGEGRMLSSRGTLMRTFRMEHLTSDRMEIEAYYNHKVIAKDLGLFLNGIVQ